MPPRRSIPFKNNNDNIASSTSANNNITASSSRPPNNNIRPNINTRPPPPPISTTNTSNTNHPLISLLLDTENTQNSLEVPRKLDPWVDFLTNSSNPHITGFRNDIVGYEQNEETKTLLQHHPSIASFNQSRTRSPQKLPRSHTWASTHTNIHEHESLLDPTTNISSSIRLDTNHDYETYETIKQTSPKRKFSPIQIWTSTASDLFSSVLPRSNNEPSKFSKRVRKKWLKSRKGAYDDEKDQDLALENNGVRFWYGDYSTIDWIHDFLKEKVRLRHLRSLKGLKGWVYNAWDASQAWILVSITGIICGCIAAGIDVSSALLSDLKRGYCRRNYLLNEQFCCWESSIAAIKVNNTTTLSCSEWVSWSDSLVSPTSFFHKYLPIDYFFYVAFAVLFGVTSSYLVCLFPRHVPHSDKVVYPAAGSGIPEIKTILGGFVMRGYLGVKTLVVKTVGLILSVSSGMSLGKEGPLVQIACCVGNITTRIFTKYAKNEGKKREILSAASAAGVAVAFGAPIGGVLFSLEEVSFFFPSKTMWRSFFCAMVTAMTLKLLNPFRTGKIVMFQVTYSTSSEWHAFEILPFIVIGIFGGVYGAGFIRANLFWNKLRNERFSRPVYEVFWVCLGTALLCYWNGFTNIDSGELVKLLLNECSYDSSSSAGHDSIESLLCQHGDLQNSFWGVFVLLGLTMVVKILLTVVTFGAKVPAGIFIPSMVVGACFGRMVGIVVGVLVRTYPDNPLFAACASSTTCINPGVYAMVGAAASLAGVTRMTVSLAVIMFELTGALNYVLPIMTGIMISKFVGDALGSDGIYDRLIDLNGHPYLDTKKDYVHAKNTAMGVMEPSPTIQIAQLYSVAKVEELIDKVGMMCLYGGDIREAGLPVVEGEVVVGYVGCNELRNVVRKIYERGNEGKSCVIRKVLTRGDVSSANTGLQSRRNTLRRDRVRGNNRNSERVLDQGMLAALRLRPDDPTRILPISESSSSLFSSTGSTRSSSSTIATSTGGMGISSDDPTSSRHHHDYDLSVIVDPETYNPIPRSPSSSSEILEGLAGYPALHPIHTYSNSQQQQQRNQQEQQPTFPDYLDLNDFTPYVDQAPLTVSVTCSMEMVLELFTKLGIRYLLVVRDGRFAGVIYKKRLLAYLRDMSGEKNSTKDLVQEKDGGSSEKVNEVEGDGNKQLQQQGHQHHDDEEEPMVDPNMVEQWIRENKELLEEVPEDEDDLDLTHNRIRTIQGLDLGKFKALKRLTFRQNLIPKIECMELVPDLDELDLYDNRIWKIEGLEPLKNMKYLDLSFNKIKVIENINHMKSLTDLFFVQNKISKIENLDGLVHLRNLELGANRVKKLENLEQLPALELLWVGKNKIAKLENLSPLKNLTLLSIQSNRIIKMEGLEELLNLEELYMSHNGIQKIEGLEKNLKLRVLDIACNRIKKLENMEHLENLEELWANGNQFSSYDDVETQLGNKKKLETVYLEGNPLQKNDPSNYRRKIKLLLPTIAQIDATMCRDPINP